MFSRKALAVLFELCNAYVLSATSIWAGLDELCQEKTCFCFVVNTKDADQSVNLHSHVSTFAIRFLESIVDLSKFATHIISIF